MMMIDDDRWRWKMISYDGDDDNYDSDDGDDGDNNSDEDVGDKDEYKW